MKLVAMAFVALMMTNQALAQEEKNEKGMELTIGPDGVDLNDKTKKEEKAFSVDYAMVDIGINTLRDNTSYGSQAAKEFLNVPTSMQNENLFSLRNGKSINVNVYPVVAKWRVQKSNNQKIYVSMGVGLQMYNFRFTKNISYVNVVNPEVILDSVGFTKNKLGLTYLSVPLMFTFKTKLAEKAWLVYGAGVTGGYRISSWTKQVSDIRGKDKNHDKFNFNDFSGCLTGEIGLDGYFRLYASYQLTPLHEDALDQRPFCIGIRFGGI